MNPIAPRFLSARAAPSHPVGWTSGLFALLVLLAGCSVQGPVTTPIPTDTVPPVPTATPATAATPGGPGPVSAYAHADDYSWVAGQLQQQGACWVVTYVSPLVDIAADQYNNHFTLQPGSGWDAATQTSGAWVIVQGKPEPGTDPAAGCPAHGYQVVSVAPNPNAPPQ